MEGRHGAAPWVGLDNYRALLHDEQFWTSFRNSISMIVAMVIIPTIIGLLLASVLFDYLGKRFGSRSASVLRATYYLPQILPSPSPACCGTGSSTPRRAR